MTDGLASDPIARLAGFVATLGRGPGRGRALTRAEAREAFSIVLAGQADPTQVGALLMLLRYRGEDADEIAGIVEAARAHAGLPLGIEAALDWPSYGAGRTRGTPWFLLAALALGRAGTTVLMHGSNEFSAGQSVADALRALGMAPAEDAEAAGRGLRRDGFAYLPIGLLSPSLEALLDLRRKLGLRSPMNTAARLLNPAAAPASVDGVFHPAYLDVHLGVAERLGQPSLLVVKGGGGEAERRGGKPVEAHRWRIGHGRDALMLPAYDAPGADPDSAPDIRAVWQGAPAPSVLATICATIALGLLATGKAETAIEADREAATVWLRRR